MGINRIHRILMEAVARGLKQVFEENQYADKVVQRLLASNRQWGARDRAFIAENLYESVRYWRLLWKLADEDPQFRLASLIRLVGINHARKGLFLPEWPEFNGIVTASIQKRAQILARQPEISESVPDWLHHLGLKELGEAVWKKELAALNTEAKLCLRVNTLKIDKQDLIQRLEEQGWQPEETVLTPQAVILQKRGNIFQLPDFQNGLFEIQDAASQLVAEFLSPEPGLRVVDACAGAGGKTLHLGCLMQNKGQIIALDTELYKLEELKRRAKRNGVDIIEVRHISSSKIIKRLDQSADQLLLDVPCSGLGVLRRNPDAKWKLSEDFIHSVRVKQQEILSRYCEMLKPGGKMVYATCSILPSENQEQVATFLAERSDFVLVEERSVSPAEQGFDGFYMALMERSG